MLGVSKGGHAVTRWSWRQHNAASPYCAPSPDAAAQRMSGTRAGAGRVAACEVSHGLERCCGASPPACRTAHNLVLHARSPVDFKTLFKASMRTNWYCRPGPQLISRLCKRLEVSTCDVFTWTPASEPAWSALSLASGWTAGHSPS